MENPMQPYAHKEKIRELLSLPLPGESAHREMMSYRRATAPEARKADPPPRQSAVLMLLMPFPEEIHTLFIRRPDYEGVHSGQISFPGGKKEETDSDLMATALRETSEEIGLEPESIEVLGTLSEIYIPPSHFLVQPYVGWLNHPAEFRPDTREVSEILIEPLQRLFAPDNITETRIYIPTFKAWIQAPSMNIQGHTLWGATAMMVHEFRKATEPEAHSFFQ
jgi:8-oxo-dGTP pyrophosphatase MutT (NUDIX family)